MCEAPPLCLARHLPIKGEIDSFEDGLKFSDAHRETHIPLEGEMSGRTGGATK
jgi:hypothetical protein